MAALAAMACLGGTANAQPAKAEPTVELRLRSVNDLIDKAEYIAGLAGQEEAIKQVREFLKQLSADGKGIEGVDPTKPFGLTATLAGDVVSSPLTVMVPIADQESFLKLLKDRLEITTEKAENGTLKAFVPIINEVYLRFTNDYVYIGRSVKELDPKTLPNPKTFFAKDDGSVGSLIVRFDSIPADLKAFVISQFELGISEQRKKNGGNENAAEKAIVDWVSDNSVSGLKSLLDDAKELQVRVFIDPKADELSGELTLTAKSGTPLSKNLADLGGKTSVPAAIVGGGKNSVGWFSAKAALPPGVKNDLDKVVDSAIQEIVKGTPDNEKALVERVLKTIAPTFKAGELDAALALNGPNAKGHYTLIGAIAVKDGKEIEKLVKDFAPFLGGAATFNFDVAKVGDFNLHTIAPMNLPDDFKKIFGDSKVWLAVSNDHVAVSLETDGESLKAGLKAKAVPAPVFSAELAFAKLVPLVGQNLMPDEIKALMKDAFPDGNPTGKDTLSISVTGGNALTVKGKLKGKGIRLLTALDQFKLNK
jgi:hypothetical protein